MPRIAASAVLSPFGDARATLDAWAADAVSPGILPGRLEDLLAGLARPLLAGRPRPDLLLLASTKGDVDRWCEGLLAGEPAAANPGGCAGLARRLGEALGISRSHAVQAACASGPLALGVAGRALQRSEAHSVLVLGADRLGAFVRDGFASLGALAERARPFDAGRSGLMLGEACGAIVLDDGPGGERLAWAAAGDAEHLTGPSRSGRGLADAVRNAVAGGPRPGLLLAHGTATRANDRAEALAYASACPGIPITAAKGCLGHSLGACGVVELALALEGRRQGRIPGVAGLRSTDTGLPLLTPSWHPMPPGPLLAASAGFGGLNGAVLLHDREAVRNPAPPFVLRRRLDLGIGPLPIPTAREALGSPDPAWGRLDLPCRVLVLLARRLEIPPGPAALVLASDAGSAGSDRRFERARRAGVPEPQRFAYTLSSAAVGEAQIRCGLTGPGLTLAGADDDQARTIALALADDGVPGVLVARIEADEDGEQRAWGEWWEE